MLTTDLKRLLQIIFLLALSGAPLTGALAQRSSETSILKWAGGSGDWTNPSNWLVNGLEAEIAPGADDHVWINAQSNITIRITDDVEVNSLSVSGSHQVKFSSKALANIIPKQGLYLSSNTSVQGPVHFILGSEVSEHSFYPYELSPSVKGNLPESSHNGIRGSCPFFTLNTVATPPTCNGANDGSVFVEEPADGVGPFLYQWVGGPAAQQWNNVGAGTYTVIVIDIGQGNLPCNTDVFVNEPGPLTVFSISASPPLCAGDCNGTATPIVIGGNGGYTYEWSSGETGITATQLCNVFTLTVTDQAGCVLDSTFTYPNPPQPVLFSPDVSNIDCFGDSDGEIVLNLSGGTPPFDLSWTGPNGFTASTSTISGLEAGSYTLNIEDSNNCLADTTIVVAENPQLTANLLVSPASCFGFTDGSITTTVSGGLPSYSFSWTGPNGFSSSDQDLLNIEAGTYDLVITDAANCVLNLQGIVDQPDEITISFTSVDILCFGENTGEINASASGGSPGYDFAWTGPNGYTANTAQILNLEAGTYTLTVTDLLNCEAQQIIELTQPDDILVDVSIIEITCSNGSDGGIELSISGGIAPYSVSWTGPNGFVSNDEDLTGLESGTYTYIIQDANNCLLQDDIILNNPAPLSIDATITPTSCSDASTGEIEILVSGGLPDYSYSWSGPDGFTSSLQNINNLASGSYSLEVTDDLGCSIVESFTVDAPQPIVASFTLSEPLCFGANTGSIVTIATGGTAPYSFAWTGPNGFTSTSQNISNLEAGDYTLVVSDFNSCEASFPVTINQPDEIVITGNSSDATCFGGDDGSLEITISGGQSPYDLAWTGPNGFTSDQLLIENLFAGTYSAEVTDANNCIQIAEFIVNQADAFVVIPTINDVVCAGDNTGSIELDVSGGTAPYSFSWTGPGGFSSNLGDIDDLFDGTYVVTITDFESCSETFSYEVGEQIILNSNAVVQNLSCFGINDGSIAITPSGGLEPYDISWDGPNGFSSSSFTIVDLVQGTYVMELRDDNGCVIQENFEITSAPEIVINLLSTDISCFDFNDGSIEASASGGLGGFTFSWTGANGFTATGAQIADLAPGIYEVTASDLADCSSTASIEIFNPLPLEVVINLFPPSCFGNDGSLEAIPSGGTVSSGYSFSWQNSGGLEIGDQSSVSGLTAGIYSLVLTDDNGCELIESVELEESPFQFNEVIVNVTCHNGSDGSISVEPIGGVEPYTFAWTGQGGFTSADQNISGLQPGIYEVTATDALGCVFAETFEVLNATRIGFNPDITAVQCPGDLNGEIALSPSGGNPGYVANWSGPDGFSAQGFTIQNLAVGEYTVSLEDVEGCIADTTIQLNLAADYEVTLNGTNPLCFGESSGAIETEITIQSGSPAPFEFLWEGPDGFTSSNQNIINLDNGTYVVTITDALGCVRTETLELVSPDEILLDVTVSSANCAQSDGGASASASGGTGLITLRWLDEDGNELVIGSDLTNVPSGVYLLQAEDEAGCVVEEIVTISDQNAEIEEVVQNPSCFGLTDGFINITIADATPPVDYEWLFNGGFFSNDQNLADLDEGTYIIVATDANNCVYSETYELVAPVAIAVQPTLVGVSCNGADGSILLEPSNGADPYTISWQGPDGYASDQFFIENLEIGIYSYSITDAQGCSVEGEIELNLIPEIQVVPTIEAVACFGDATGGISINVSGGTPEYSYSWSFGGEQVSTQENLTDVVAGEYSLEITDANNCIFTETYSIDQPDPINIEATIIAPDCGASNGEINVIITGGTALNPYFISWTDGDGNPLSPSTSLTGLDAGVYNLLVADDNGCEADTTIVLSNPGADIEIAKTDVSCFGFDDGTITLTINGVTEPFVITWTGPDFFTGSDAEITNLAPGLYEYSIEDPNGCIYLGQSEILEPAPLTISAVGATSCFGENSGSISSILSGGVEPYALSWTGPDGFTSSQTELTNLAPGMYMADLTDQNGCSSSTSVEILENPEITISTDQTDVLCFGQSTGQLATVVGGGTAPLSIEWLGDDGFSSTDLVISNLPVGSYTLIVTDAEGCQRSEEYQITSPDALIVEETIQQPGCVSSGGLGSISLNPFGGTPDYQVSWTGPDGFTSDELNILDLQEGIYDYTLIDASGCEAQGSVELIANPPIIVQASIENISCAGETDGSISISIEGGVTPYTVVWTGPEGFSSSDLELQDLLLGIYNLTVIDDVGCEHTETYEISEPGPIFLVQESIIDATCNTSQDGAVQYSISGGTPPYTFAWTGPNGFGSEDLNINELGFGLYSLTVIDANECLASEEANIGFELEILANAGTDTAICASALPVTLTGTGLNTDLYFWTDLDGNTVSDTEVLTIDESTGIYTYVLTASNGFCNATDTLEVEILSNPEVDAGPDLEVFVEEVFQLGGNPTSPTAVSYAWTPQANGSIDTTLANPVGFLLNSTEFVVFATDINGCIGSDTVFVEVLPEVVITSGFTPNSDGLNDFWVLDNMELFPNNTVQIFNRSGLVVFEMRGYNNGAAWDGTYEGEPVPIGTYYYTIELNDPRFPNPFTGPLTINR
jgi:gliding motility-associated-like protein